LKYVKEKTEEIRLAAAVKKGLKKN